MPRIGPTDWQTLEKIFVADGFTFRRQKGSHRVYTKPGIPRPVIIPTYDPVGMDIIKSNMRTAGMSNERFEQLLGTPAPLDRLLSIRQPVAHARFHARDVADGSLEGAVLELLALR